MFKVNVLDLLPDSSGSPEETRVTHTNQQKNLSKGEYSLERQIGVTHTKRQKQLISYTWKKYSGFP